MWSRGDNPFDLALGGYQVRNILEHVRGDSLLDLGCNDGWLVRALAARFQYIIGADADEGKIQLAQQLSPEYRIGFQCSPIEELSLHGEYDTITLINVLEHVKDPVLVLKKAKGWLAPEGVIIIHVPNAMGLNRRLGVEMGLLEGYHQLTKQDRKIGHRRFYNPVTLKRDIKRAGLQVEDMGGVMVKPFSNEQMQRIADGWKEAEKVFDGLYKLAREMPDYASPIWAVCRR